MILFKLGRNEQMVANKCDRCGKLFEERTGYMNTPRVDSINKTCYDVPMIEIHGVANNTRNTCFKRSKELCYECYEEFLKWFDRESTGDSDG